MIGLGLGGGFGGSYEQATTVISLLGADAFENSLHRIAGAWGKVDESQVKASRSGAAMQRIGLGLTAGLSGSMVSGIVLAAKFGSELEMVKAALTGTLGSAEAASQKLAELQAFAKTTPFNFSETAKGAQLLLAYGIKGKDLIGIMTGVGNAVAAAGGGNEAFTSSLRAIGQMNTKGKVMSQDLNQLAEHGIPAFEILQRKLGLTAGQMRHIGEEGIASDKAIRLLVAGFSEGRFVGALENQSKTLRGMWSNTQDEMQQTFAELGISMMPIFKDGIGLIRQVTPPIKTAVKWFTELDETTRRWGLGLGLAAGPLTLLAGKAITVAAALKQLRNGGLPGLPGLSQIPGLSQAPGLPGGFPGFGGGYNYNPVAKRWQGANGKFVTKDEALAAQNGNGLGGGHFGTINITAQIVNLNGSGVGGAPGGAGAPGTEVAGGVAGRNALSRFLFPAGLTRNMGPHVGGFRGLWASQAPSKAGLAAAARAPGAIGLGIGFGIAGYEGMRALNPAFAKSHGNTFEASRNVLGRLTHGWDFERGQSNYDSQMQMKDASAKYNADVETTKKAAADWAKKNGKSPAEEQAEYFRRLSELEKNWSRQYAGNLSLGGFTEHESRRKSALKKGEEMQRQAAAENLDKYLHAVYPSDAFKPFQISSDGTEKRRIYQRWTKANFGEKSAAGMMAKWDKDNAPKEEAAPRRDWNSQTAQLAGMFGLGPANNVISASSKENRDDTTTITIGARAADKEHRALRTLNRTPKRPMP